MNLSDLQKEAHAIAKDHGWWDQERTFGDLIALVHSELSEALEAYREWGLRSVISATAPNDRTYRYFDINLSQAKMPDDWTTKPDGVASELADVVIRVADMAERLGISVSVTSHELDEGYAGEVIAGCHSFGDWIAALHRFPGNAFSHRLRSLNVVEDDLKAVVYGVQRMAAHYGIDLDAAIEAKMQYNRSRSYRHGGKAL